MSGQLTTIKAGNMLAAINPTTFEEVQRFARMAAVAGIGPFKTEEDFESKIGKCSMAILKGLELGIPAMQALESLALFNGRFLIYGDLLTSILWGRGFRIRKWTEGEGDNRVGHAEIIRPDKTVIAKSFSVSQAKQARLWDTRETVRRHGRGGNEYNAPNDAPWHRYPERMLEWRAFGFAVKDGASDATHGMLVYEEMAPEVNQIVDVTPEPAAPKKAPPKVAPPSVDIIPDFDDGATAAGKTPSQIMDELRELAGLSSMHNIAPDQALASALIEQLPEDLRPEAWAIVDLEPAE